MNDKHEPFEQKLPPDLPPLDAFEQQWVDQLAQHEPDLKQTEDAFVQSVMQAQAASATASSAVVGRIGFTLLPYAAAAAVLLAAFVGWYVLKGDADEASNEQPIANQPGNAPQPDDASSVVTNDRPRVELGKLIAQAKSTATRPATNLTTTVSEMPETLSFDRLFDLMGDSMPDLKEILAPLEQKNEQSRA